MSVPELYASGLSSERTELAWRRTVLGLLVGSVVAWRVLTPALGWWAIAAGIAGLVVTAVVWRLASARSRAASAALRGERPAPGGGLLLLLTVVVASAAAAAIGYLLG